MCFSWYQNLSLYFHIQQDSRSRELVKSLLNYLGMQGMNTNPCFISTRNLRDSVQRRKMFIIFLIIVCKILQTITVLLGHLSLVTTFLIKKFNSYMSMSVKFKWSTNFSIISIRCKKFHASSSTCSCRRVKYSYHISQKKPLDITTIQVNLVHDVRLWLIIKFATLQERH